MGIGVTQEQETQGPITDLPNEMLAGIFQYLDPVSIGRMAQVSRQMHAVSQDPMIWKDHILSNLEKNEVSPLTYSWIEKLLMSGQIAPQLFAPQAIYKQFSKCHVLKELLSPKYQTLYSKEFTVKQLAGLEWFAKEALGKYIDKLVRFTTEQLAGFNQYKINALGKYIEQLAGYTTEQLAGYDEDKINALGKYIEQLASFTTEQLAGFDWYKINALGENIDKLLAAGFKTEQLAGYNGDELFALADTIDKGNHFAAQAAASEEVVAGADMLHAEVVEAVAVPAAGELQSDFVE